MQDVVIVGGGVIGLSVAYELAQRGLDVVVADQSAIGSEASWAGAGMLPPGDLSGIPAMRSLAEQSFARWPVWSEELKSRTGIDNGFRRSGAIQVQTSLEQDMAADTRAWREIGVEVELLDRSALHRQEPAVHPQIQAGYRLPAMAQIRNPWHLKALRAACLDLGVRLLPGTPVVGWERQEERLVAARTPTDRLSAATFVVTAGAWTSALLQPVGVRTQIEPVRGQIVLLRVDRLPFRQIIESGPRYLVPRGDGRILVGSTEERVGFLKANTAEGVRGLLDFAIGIVPELKQASLERTWSGLRPCAVRGRPYIGQVPDYGNLFLAAGHFRAGLSNSPGTAQVVRELVTGDVPSIDVSHWTPDAPSPATAFTETTLTDPH